jgi:hypothetical protein
VRLLSLIKSDRASSQAARSPANGN